MAQLYLDPQSDGIIVTTPQGRKRFPATTPVAKIMDHLLMVERGKGAPLANSLGTGTPVPPDTSPKRGAHETVIVRRVKADPKLRRPKPARVHLTLDQLLAE